ncbi:MAG: AMP-binding protein [Eubacteriales bacterium]|nr:AMP-binding protein [Eubacteriales bacterium]
MEQIPVSVLDRWIGRKHFSSEELSKEQLAEYQIKKISETIKMAKENSPFYRETYQDLPLPETMEDFKKYPLMDGDDLIRDGGKMLCVSQRDIQRVVTLSTSGTTKSPKRIYFTQQDQELTIDFFAYGMEEVTAKGERVAICLPWKSEGCVGDLLMRGLQRREIQGVGVGLIENLHKAADCMIRNHTQAAVAIPTQLLALMEYVKRQKMELPLKRVLTSTDLLSDSVRQRLEAFGLEVFDHLGMTECGLGVALECKAHQGMHIRENDLYLEVVDLEGKPVPDGRFGELVMTTLTRNGMPLIRYRMGDRARILSGNCSCGSVLRRVEVTGRLGERTFRGWGIRQWDEFLFSFPEVLDYQLVQKPNRSWSLILEGFDALSPKTAMTIREKTMGVQIECRQWEGQLPVYTGKRCIHYREV